MSRKEYSEVEHAAIADAYVALVAAQIAGRKVSKAEIVRGLMATTGRTRGAIEAKFMNMSAAAVAHGLFPELPDGYVKGYKPAPNGAKSLPGFIVAAMVRGVRWSVAA